MQNGQEIKKVIKEKYSDIVLNVASSSCCSSSSCCGTDELTTYSVFSDDYNELSGYNPDADYELGCGIPTKIANIKKGDVVVDLGSGAGNDVFVAHSLVGENGFVIGIDMTEEMISKANKNKEISGIKNIKFVHSDIENMPLENNSADVVISNCVINLVADKEKVFSEIYRILKTGGHFSISDVVLNGVLPDELRKSAELYAGCISGAIPENGYLKIIQNAGFSNVEVKIRKKIELSIELLKLYLTDEQISQYNKNDIGLFSITVFAKK